MSDFALLFAPRPAWFDQAACTDTHPSLFFADEYDAATAMEAKAVCARCPVRSECLEWALTNGERHGVWGGTSPKERGRMLRERLEEAS